MKNLSQNEFIARCVEKYGNKFDYSKTIYSNKRKKVIITCPIHGDVNVYPLDFLNSSNGCPICGKEYAKFCHKGGKAEFIKKLLMVKLYIARKGKDATVEADLKNSGFAVKSTKVLACRVADVPGGLGKIVEVLAQKNINLEYLYGCASSPDNEAKIILKVDQIAEAEQALQCCLADEKKDLF